MVTWSPLPPQLTIFWHLGRQEHHAHLEVVLERICAAGIRLNR